MCRWPDARLEGRFRGWRNHEHIAEERTWRVGGELTQVMGAGQKAVKHNCADLYHAG
jgi:hypothetical protein